MFDPVDFVNLADQLVRTVPTDAVYRTAIGRAYYGAFLAARSHEGRRCGSSFPSTPAAHKLVMQSLEDYDENLAADLDSLRTLRNRADYDLNYQDAGDDCYSAIESAQFLLRQLNR